MIEDMAVPTAALPKTAMTVQRTAEREVTYPGLVFSGWWRRAWGQVIDGPLAFAGLVGLIAIGFATGNDGGIAAGIVAGILFYVLYFTLGHGSKSGKTLGKKVLGIAVKGRDDFGRISYGRAFGRLLAFFLIGWIPLVGLLNILAPLWSRDHQAWHDRMMDTVVVRTR
jgi:uncharacterized RDD family membrane protein YckC